MDLTIHGHHIDVGDALREHVEDKLEDLNSKYFNHATFATVTFSKEGHGHPQIRVHISIKLGKDILIIADNEAGDPYAAFDSAAEKAGKQLRRYKRKLRDHHERLEQTPESEISKANNYVIQVMESEKDTNEAPGDDDGVPQGDDPAIIAELTTDILTMSVSDAVMRMDLAGQNALMFRNAKNDGINVVYRRKDGNIGWIDPEIVEERRKKSA